MVRAKHRRSSQQPRRDRAERDRGVEPLKKGPFVGEEDLGVDRSTHRHLDTIGFLEKKYLCGERAYLLGIAHGRLLKSMCMCLGACVRDGEHLCVLVISKWSEKNRGYSIIIVLR